MRPFPLFDRALLCLFLSIAAVSCGSSSDATDVPDDDASVDSTAADVASDSRTSDVGDSTASDTADASRTDTTPADTMSPDAPLDAVPDLGTDASGDVGDADARDAVATDARDARADGGCLTNSDCASDEMCDAPTCIGPGACIKKPGIGVLCRVDPDSWCGCDGTDYMSVCNAHKAGVRVAHAGSCSATACGATGDCSALGADYVCSFTVGNCTVPGFCKAEAFCPGSLTSYCDCSGATVSTNPCKADKSGTRLASSGACP
jgi:hypothetical protein